MCIRDRCSSCHRHTVFVMSPPHCVRYATTTLCSSCHHHTVFVMSPSHCVRHVTTTPRSLCHHITVLVMSPPRCFRYVTTTLCSSCRHHAVFVPQCSSCHHHTVFVMSPPHCVRHVTTTLCSLCHKRWCLSGQSQHLGTQGLKNPNTICLYCTCLPVCHKDMSSLPCLMVVPDWPVAIQPTFCLFTAIHIRLLCS